MKTKNNNEFMELKRVKCEDMNKKELLKMHKTIYKICKQNQKVKKNSWYEIIDADIVDLVGFANEKMIALPKGYLDFFSYVLLKEKLTFREFEVFSNRLIGKWNPYKRNIDMEQVLDEFENEVANGRTEGHPSNVC